MKVARVQKDPETGYVVVQTNVGRLLVAETKNAQPGDFPMGAPLKEAWSGAWCCKYVSPDRAWLLRPL